MAVYGIGATFGKKDYLDCFIDESVAFLNYTESVTPELYVLLRRIKNGDILYVKSYNPKGFTIKAVGIVQGDIIEQNRIPVEWIWKGNDGEDEEKGGFIKFPANMDKYNVRNIALYEEFNQKVLDKVLNKAFPEEAIHHIDKKAFWEYVRYLDVSSKCFDLAANSKVDFDTIKNQIANYGKSFIDKFMENNNYHKNYNPPISSFNLFGEHIRFNADTYYKQLSDKDFLPRKRQRTETTEILDGNFISDYWPYIEPQKKEHKKDFLAFFTDEKVFEILYNQAENDIRKNDKKANNELYSILKASFESFYASKKRFLNEINAEFTSQYLINWMLLLQKYIEKTIALLNETSKAEVDIKLLAYILKALCVYGMELKVKDDAFINFIKKLLGTTLSTTDKYISSSDMGYKEGFANTWFEGLELLSTLDKDNPLIRKCIKEVIINRPVNFEKILSHDQVEFYRKQKKEYPPNSTL